MAVQSVVTFSADGSLYAVPVDCVQEILDLQPVSPLPRVPNALLGVTNLRGGNVPVLDLRRLLGRAEAEDTPQTRILVVWVENKGRRMIAGLRTDRVVEVCHLDEAELRPAEDKQYLGWSGGAIVGLGRRNGEIVCVLDLERLFGGALPEPESEAA